MGNENESIKARMFVGGLKSLFVDMAETLDEVEKTGSMPVDMLQSLLDLKAAIDMTLVQLSKTQMRCCEHAPACDHDEDDDLDEELCEGCDEPCEDCECEDEEEQEPPPPPTPRKVKKESDKVVIPTKKTKH